MQWKQFFTPISSISPEQAVELLAKSSFPIKLLDVRQPAEYAAGHIPGAYLIPLGELPDRLEELDKEVPTLVYCASGGRSLVAAQFLVGQNFTDIINMLGGFGSWQNLHENKKWISFGDYTQGHEIFDDKIELHKVLAMAWGMEAALEEFYTRIALDAHEAGKAKASNMLNRLAKFELSHKATIEHQYARLPGDLPPLPHMVTAVAEGGMTTDEYLRLSQTDLREPTQILGFAIMLEAQAMDLYTRAACWTTIPETQNLLASMAREEQAHMRQVSALLDSFLTTDIQD